VVGLLGRDFDGLGDACGGGGSGGLRIALLGRSVRGPCRGGAGRRDRLDQLALAEPGRALEAELGGESLELRHLERGQVAVVHAPGVEFDISH